MRVAYATHSRALMLFAHDWGPSRSEREAAGCEEPSDVTATALFGAPILSDWTSREILRLCDADQLAAHISERRDSRRGSGREWGNDPDWELVKPRVPS